MGRGFPTHRVVLLREEKAQSLVSMNFPEAIESARACWSGSGMSIKDVGKEGVALSAPVDTI